MVQTREVTDSDSLQHSAVMTPLRKVQKKPQLHQQLIMLKYWVILSNGEPIYLLLTISEPSEPLWQTPEWRRCPARRSRSLTLEPGPTQFKVVISKSKWFFKLGFIFYRLILCQTIEKSHFCHFKVFQNAFVPGKKADCYVSASFFLIFFCGTDTPAVLHWSSALPTHPKGSSFGNPGLWGSNLSSPSANCHIFFLLNCLLCPFSSLAKLAHDCDLVGLWSC